MRRRVASGNACVSLDPLKVLTPLCGCHRCCAAGPQLRSAVAAGWTLTPKEGKGLVAMAMSRGYWQLAEELILHSKTVRGADMTHAVYKSASSIRKRLKLLEEALSAKKRNSKG